MWGLQQTTLGSRQRQDTGTGILRPFTGGLNLNRHFRWRSLNGHTLLGNRGEKNLEGYDRVLRWSFTVSNMRHFFEI